MTAKILVFWALSIIALACCLFLPIESDKTSEISPQSINSLFVVEPHTLYYSNEKFHANVAGKLKLEIKTNSFIQNLLNYDVIVIEGLETDLNTQISLNWQQDNRPLSLLLNTNHTSVNQVNFGTTDIQSITEMHLLISSNFELGTRPNIPKELAFKSIYFDTKQNHSSALIEINEWLDFTPVKFNSINGYSNSENLHFKSLIQRLTIWVLVNVTLFLLLRLPGLHLIASLTLAWLITLTLFTHNFIKQNQQIKTVFDDSDHYLNQQDVNTYNLAQMIMSDIKADSSIDFAQQKFVIVGPSDFYHLRLYHHLMTLNVAINNSELSTLLQKESSQRYIYILTKQPMNHCINSSESNDLNTEILGQQSEYCLVRSL